MIDTNRISNVKVEDIKMNDYPKFCDAFIAEADYEEEDGTVRELTDEELDELNNGDYGDFIYSQVEKELY